MKKVIMDIFTKHFKFLNYFQLKNLIFIKHWSSQPPVSFVFEFNVIEWLIFLFQLKYKKKPIQKFIYTLLYDLMLWCLDLYLLKWHIYINKRPKKNICSTYFLTSKINKITSSNNLPHLVNRVRALKNKYLSSAPFLASSTLTINTQDADIWNKSPTHEKYKILRAKSIVLQMFIYHLH